MTPLCPSKETMLSLINGELPESDADAFQLHLESCTSCPTQLQELVADGGFWQTAASSLSDQDIGGPELDKVVESLQQQSPEDAEEMGEAIELRMPYIEPPVEPGTIGRLQHYDLLRVAGRGGMGIVVKAFDRSLRRVVAIKMLAPHLAGNGQARQRFVREGRAAAAICHEHVITIHSVEEDPPFLVMQFVLGETLEARIHRNGAIDIRETVRIAMQIAQGLAAAHAQGVIHRDIKPANILLENGVARVRITDFGLARAVDDASLTQSGVVAGTPQYMAPEQANGDPIDERADLFSLGSVLYTMLAGHAPFRATTTMGVLRRLCDHAARPIREINPEVPEWLMRLLDQLHTKRPADRPQSAEEVAVLLGRGLANLQNSAIAVPEVPVVPSSADSSVIPADETASSAAPTQTAAPQEVRRILPRWMFRPLPLWVVFLVIALCSVPFAPTAALFSGSLALLWFVVPMLRESHADDDGSSRSVHDFMPIRMIRRMREVAPSTRLGYLAWLTAWILPCAAWTIIFFDLEEQILRGGPLTRVVYLDQQMITTAFAVCFAWLAVGIFWFKRRDQNGQELFTRQSRWSGSLATLGLAGVFALCGYSTWESDVYRRVMRQTTRVSASTESPVDEVRSESVKVSIPRPAMSMLRTDFESSLNGLELVIDLADGRQSRFDPGHNRVVTQFTEGAGTYDWHVHYRGRSIHSGEVTFNPGELSIITVPQPTLGQLIAGRWESRTIAAVEGPGGLSDYDDQKYEFEFDGSSGLIAVYEPSGEISRMDVAVSIDESTTPALINMSEDAGDLVGIIKLISGQPSPVGGPGLPPVGSSMGSQNRVASSPAPEFGGEGGGTASPQMATAYDQLLICVNDSRALRPWEFRDDRDEGQTLFTLVRSREKDTLRNKLALEAVDTEASARNVTEAAAAWARKLIVEDVRTNSIGIELVLVPPSKFRRADPTHRPYRIELPALAHSETPPDAENSPPGAVPGSPVIQGGAIRMTADLIDYPFAISRMPVTRGQFRQFIEDTGYRTDADKGTSVPFRSISVQPSASKPGIPGVTPPASIAVPAEADESNDSARLAPGFDPARSTGGWELDTDHFDWEEDISWELPSLSERTPLETDSVGVVSWRDATAFCAWLSSKESRQYRLPTAREWEATMQLGVQRKRQPELQRSKIDSFDNRHPHPLRIQTPSSVFAEWTNDSANPQSPLGRVLVRRKTSTDELTFSTTPQYQAHNEFRATEVSFRVVAEIRTLSTRGPERSRN